MEPTRVIFGNYFWLRISRWPEKEKNMQACILVCYPARISMSQPQHNQIKAMTSVNPTKSLFYLFYFCPPRFNRCPWFGPQTNERVSLFSNSAMQQGSHLKFSIVSFWLYIDLLVLEVWISFMYLHMQLHCMFVVSLIEQWFWFRRLYIDCAWIGRGSEVVYIPNYVWFYAAFTSSSYHNIYNNILLKDVNYGCKFLHAPKYKY